MGWEFCTVRAVYAFMKSACDSRQDCYEQSQWSHDPSSRHNLNALEAVLESSLHSKLSGAEPVIHPGQRAQIRVHDPLALAHLFPANGILLSYGARHHGLLPWLRPAAEPQLNALPKIAERTGRCRLWTAARPSCALLDMTVECPKTGIIPPLR